MVRPAPLTPRPPKGVVKYQHQGATKAMVLPLALRTASLSPTQSRKLLQLTALKDKNV